MLEHVRIKATWLYAKYMSFCGINDTESEVLSYGDRTSRCPYMRSVTCSAAKNEIVASSIRYIGIRLENHVRVKYDSGGLSRYKNVLLEICTPHPVAPVVWSTTMSEVMLGSSQIVIFMWNLILCAVSNAS